MEVPDDGQPGIQGIVDEPDDPYPCHPQLLLTENVEHNKPEQLGPEGKGGKEGGVVGMEGEVGKGEVGKGEVGKTPGQQPPIPFISSSTPGDALSAREVDEIYQGLVADPTQARAYGFVRSSGRWEKVGEGLSATKRRAKMEDVKRAIVKGL